ncbi:late embryogenesis abundant protein Lea14-A-like [Wolffia australiana]
MAHLLNKAKEVVVDKLAHIKKPEAKVADVGFGHVSRDSATLLSKLEVTNPYDHAIPVCEISYTFRSGNRVVASGKMPDPGSLTANGQTRLEVPVKVPYDFLLSIAKDIGKDWDIDYELELGLTVDLPIFGNFTIPLTKRGETKLPTLSNIF